MRKICYVASRLCKNAKKSFMYIKNSENTHFGQFSNDTLLFYANRNKAEPREVTKQVVWIILRNRIFHRTIRHIRSGFPSYARTLCALTLFAYALKQMVYRIYSAELQLNKADSSDTEAAILNLNLSIIDDIHLVSTKCMVNRMIVI